MTSQTNLAVAANVLDPLAEKVAEGKGLEVIAQHGWRAFRSALVQLSYSDIIKRQVRQIEDLVAQVSPNSDYSLRDVQTRNSQSARRAKNDFYDELYEKGIRITHSPIFDGKLKFGYVDLDAPPIVRFYVNVEIANALDAIVALHGKMNAATAGARPLLKEANLNLFIGNIFHEKYQSHIYKNNGLIVVTSGNNAEVNESVARAILEAKSDSQFRHLFELPPKYLAHAKLGIVKDLTVPLDDTVCMVEMPDNESYHYRNLPSIRRSLGADKDESKYFHGKTPQHEYGRDHFSNDINLLRRLARRLSLWKSLTTDTMRDFPERRAHMPALVFDISKYSAPQGMYGV